jgi:hypothetical protein
MFFSPNRAQALERSEETQACRHSITISMMEAEFGRCEPPQPVTRFGGCPHVAMLSQARTPFTTRFSSGVLVPTTLRILPPKRRKHSCTQTPELRRNLSFLKRSWATVWDVGADEPCLLGSPSNEGVASPLDLALSDGKVELDRTGAVPRPPVMRHSGRVRMGKQHLIAPRNFGLTAILKI